MIAHANLGLGAAQFGLDYGVSNAARPRARGRGRSTSSTPPPLNRDRRWSTPPPAYGDGERVLGRSWPFPSPFRVVHQDRCALAEGLDRVEDRARRSLERLGLSRGRRRAGRMRPRTCSAPTAAALWDRLQELKDDGLFQKIGFSRLRLETIRRCWRAASSPTWSRCPCSPARPAPGPATAPWPSWPTSASRSTCARSSCRACCSSTATSCPRRWRTPARACRASAARLAEAAGRPAAGRAGLRPGPARGLGGDRRRRPRRPSCAPSSPPPAPDAGPRLGRRWRWTPAAPLDRRALGRRPVSSAA